MRDSCSSQCFYSHMHNNDTPSCLEAQLSNYLLIVYVWRERFIYLTLYLIVLFSLVLYFKRRSQFEQTDWKPKQSSASSAVTVSCCENWKHSYRHLLTTTRLQLGFISCDSVSCCENWKHSYRHLLATTRLQLGFICCDSVLLRELETQLSPSTDHNETSARLHQLWQCVLLRELETQLSPSTGHNETSARLHLLWQCPAARTGNSYRHLLATTRLQLGFICCDSVLLRELETQLSPSTDHNETSARLHLLWQCPAARTGNTAIAIYWPQRDFSSASSAVTVSCCENWKHSYRHLLTTTRLQLGFICCDSVLLRELETQLSPSTGHNETSARLHLLWQCPAARTGNTAIAIYWPQRDFSSASSAVTVSCCENWKHSYRHLLATTRLQLGFICCDSVLLWELETAIAIYWPQRDSSSD